MKIGFFDSGIGGLSVLHQALKKLPQEDYIYYADVDNVPYGTKSKNEIIQYVDSAVNFILSQDVKAIVIACNTATSVAIDYLRSKYKIPILGMEPAVKVAVKNETNKRVMIMATPVTIREDKLRNLIQQVDAKGRTDLLPLPQLVRFAESGEFHSNRVREYLLKELGEFHLGDYGTVVLGCTHFNYFKDTMHTIFSEDVEFIDGINGTVNHLYSILEQKGLLEQGTATVTCYQSGRLVERKHELQRYNKLFIRLDQMYDI